MVGKQDPTYTRPNAKEEQAMDRSCPRITQTVKNGPWLLLNMGGGQKGPITDERV